MALLDKIKLTCRVTTHVYDDELTDLINAAFADMGITDIDSTKLTETNIDPLILRAVGTYCKMNFGKIDGQEYDRLKASYDEQKKQMGMASGYTVFMSEDA